MANTITVEIDIEGQKAKSDLNQFEKEAAKTGKKAGDALEKNLGGSFKSIGRSIARVGALFGTFLTGATVVKAIQSANEQADAVERLNTALRANNEFSQQASEDLQRYAAELQSVTEFGDELILNQLALAKSFGATNEQAKLIAETATGLSKEFGISLESATRNAARTLGGFAGELGEVIPELKEFTAEQLRNGEAITLLNNRFGDSAKDLGTFSFTLAQAKNSLGDLLEEAGKLVTQNPEVRRGLEELTKIFQGAGKEVKEFASEFSFIDDLLIPLSNFSDDIITFVISPLELLSNVLELSINVIATWQAALIAAFGKVGGAAAEFIRFFDEDSEAAQALQNFSESSQEAFLDVADSAKKSFDGILDFPFSDELSKRNEEIRTGLKAFQDTIVEEGGNTATTIDDILLEAIRRLKSQGGESLLGLSISFSSTTEGLQDQAKQTAAIVRNSLGRGIAGAVSLLVKNLQAGKSAFADFGKFVAGVFGDLAIQLGQFFIIEGFAVEALKSLGGAAAVKAGVALVALGTLLKASSGAGGSGAATAGTSGGAADSFAGGSTPADGGVVAEADPAEEQTQNQIIIQGDVFDTEETGNRIFEIISAQSEKNGNVIVGGAFA